MSGKIGQEGPMVVKVLNVPLVDVNSELEKDLLPSVSFVPISEILGVTHSNFS